MTEHPYQIRLARAEDLLYLPAIERAAGQLFAQTAYAFIADHDPTPLKLLEAQQRQGLVWVATGAQQDTQQQPVGFALAKIVGSEVYLQELSVHPAHGRQGIGRRLIEQLGQWAGANGYTTLTLSTFRDIGWNAPYYARLGFRPLEQVELSQSLQQIQQKEQEAGLPSADRVFMILRL